MGSRQEQLVPVCRRHDVRLLVAFGSRAGGRAGLGSDTDVAILLSRPPGDEGVPLALVAELREAMGVSGPLDVVILNHLESTTLGREIVREGKVLYDCDGEQFATFATRAMKAYADFAGFRRLRADVLAGRQIT